MIEDLGSAVGLLFSIQNELVNMHTITDILPTLDLYSRVLDSFERKGFRTVCVVFDGSEKPFWFGSTLHHSTKKVLVTRQGLLMRALSRENLCPPLVPPAHQQVVAKHIMNIAVGGLVVKQNTKWWKEARQSCVELFQLMTVPGNLGRKPWNFRGTLTLDQQTVFDRIGGEIADQIYAGMGQVSVNAIIARLEFGLIKASVEGSVKGLRLVSVYGNSAETYPFIFLLNRMYLSFLIFFFFFSRPLGFPWGTSRLSNYDRWDWGQKLSDCLLNP